MIIATNNEKKLKELSAILVQFNIEAIGLKQAGINIEIEENGDTFEQNALIKARAVYMLTKKPSIADDSGLEVDALNGRPGVYSARYAGENATDADRNNKLLLEMSNVDKKNRKARFVSAIAYVDSNCEFVVRGECEGEILFECAGEGGFGYDPLFYVNKFKKTFGQLDEKTKNDISHRALALKLFKNKFKEMEENK